MMGRRPNAINKKQKGRDRSERDPSSIGGIKYYPVGGRCTFSSTGNRATGDHRQPQANITLFAGDLLPDHFGRTKTGEGRLDQVEPDKTGQDKPVGRNRQAQRQRGQDQRTGQNPDHIFDTHRQTPKNRN